MATDWAELVAEAARLIAGLQKDGLMLATAESCTGGLIAAALTEVPGSSAVFERGFVTYSDGAKAELLGVRPELLERHGAVSQAVARAMAEGALDRTPADIAVAVTGIAGPGGGSAEKPVGLVHIAAARRRGPVLHRELRIGDIGRRGVRLASAAQALALARDLL